MGWCHEFGPQITEGCDHPMVAGAAACTCAVCGAVCEGRFGGCADVWAEGPRQVPPRVPPVSDEPDRLPGDAQPLPGAPAGDLAPERDDRAEAVAVAPDQVTDRMTVLDEVSAPVLAVEAGTGRVNDIDQMLTVMAQALDRLSGRMSALDSVPSRVDALEQAGPAVPVPPDEIRGGLADKLERLSAQVAALESLPRQRAVADELSRRLAALESTPERLAEVEHTLAQIPAAKVISDLVKGSERTIAHLDRLSTQMGPLQAIPKRMASVEAAQGRLSAVEKAFAGLVRSVQQQSAEMAALQESSERVAALGPTVAGLGHDLEEVRAHVAPVTEVAKRVEALEQAGAPPSEKLLASITKRLDRLSTQVALTKEVPDRLEALEKAAADDGRASESLERLDRLAIHVHALRVRMEDVPSRLATLEQSLAPNHVLDQLASRTEALSRGLSGAIDMIDQLSHQVTLLESSSSQSPAAE